MAFAELSTRSNLVPLGVALPPPGALPVRDPAIAALLEAVRRAARGGAPRRVLLLRMNAAHGFRPHHVRVAQAILADAATAGAGEVLRLGDGALALVSQTPHDAVVRVLEGLFAAIPRGGTELYTRWELPRDGAALQTYLLHDRPEPQTTLVPVPPRRPGAADTRMEATDPLAAAARLAAIPVAPLLHRQIALRIEPVAGGRRMRPWFEAISLPAAALETRMAAEGMARADPFVFRYLSARLDEPVLTALIDAVMAPPDRAVPLHVSLSLDAVGGVLFEQLAAACRARERGFAVELGLLDACAEPGRYQAARTRLAQRGIGLVLTGLTHDTLALIAPEALNGALLGADLLKLEWPQALPNHAGGHADRLNEAIAAIGPSRLVLQGADNDAALVSGLARGIRIFQGRQIDAILAAGRMTACTYAARCTLRQCVDRAAALTPEGRAGCHDLSLLTGGAQRDLVLGA